MLSLFQPKIYVDQESESLGGPLFSFCVRLLHSWVRSSLSYWIAGDLPYATSGRRELGEHSDVSDASTQPNRPLHSAQRKPEPFLRGRTLLLLGISLVVTLLFVREHRRQQGPCSTQFHARMSSKPRLLLVQDDEDPGDPGPPADPCNNQRVFSISPERAYAALALALWGVTAFCAAQDITAFRKDRRRRQRRTHHAGNRTSVKGGQIL